MPLDPELGGTYNHNALLKGVEFHTGDGDIFPADAYNQNARCFSKRFALMMLPGKQSCLDGWHKEYNGRIIKNC